MTNTHTATDTLTALYTHDDLVATALAAELVSLADQADANATRYTQHPDDHGRIGSASRAYRNVATSLRWRAQMIVAAADADLRRVAAESNWTGPVQDAIRDHDRQIAQQQRTSS